ncbi:cupin domain-containing protein [Streptomyces sp. NPDC002018]|uniref:cupin domain-containing protein n=1 Tax=Streptomyces sp. NPDC002018 TaxID=3364629 RepID=UPI0036CE0E0D
MLAFVNSTVAALDLQPDEAGGWSAPVIRPTGADEAPGPGARTRLLGPGVRLRWRRATADVVMFAHPGAEICVSFRDSARGRVMTILGDDPGAGHVPQYVVPAGVTHTVSPAPGEFALWSETLLGSVGTGWEFPEGTNPYAVLHPPLPGNRGNYAVASRSTALRPRLAPTRLAELALSTVRGALVSLSVLTGGDVMDRLHTREQDVTYLLAAGGPVHHLLVSPEGVVREHRLGPDPASGHIPAVTVPAGWWRASYLPAGAGDAVVSELVRGAGSVARDPIHADDILRTYPRLSRNLLPYASD